MVILVQLEKAELSIEITLFGMMQFLKPNTNALSDFRIKQLFSERYTGLLVETERLSRELQAENISPEIKVTPSIITIDRILSEYLFQGEKLIEG